MKRLLLKIIFLSLSLSLFSQEENSNSTKLESEKNLSTNISKEKIKLKEISEITPTETQNLTGIGIVAGLTGKGDSLKDPKIKETVNKILLENGINIQEILSKNIALVIINLKVRGNLIKGDVQDVYVASILDSKDLNGGILLKSELKDKDGNVLAYVSGPLTLKEKIKGLAFIKDGAVINENKESGSTYNLTFTGNSYDLLEKVSKALNSKNIKNKVKSSNIIELDVKEDNMLSEIENIEIEVLPKVFIDEQNRIISASDNVEIGSFTFFFEKEETNRLLQNSNNNSKIKIEIPKIKLNDFILKNSDSLKSEDIIEIIKAAKKINKLNGELIMGDN